ncbi:MAG: fluoride efflux transporter CrcB [Pseudomonadota bacterium]
MDTLTVKVAAAVAAGGALGAVARLWVYTVVHGQFGRAFPYGTLVVNVVGSLAMGIAYVWLVERLSVSVEWRAFAVVGLLGAFTTFSAFSIETLNLLADGAPLRALTNVALNVGLCVLAAWAGVSGARWLS